MDKRVNGVCFPLLSAIIFIVLIMLPTGLQAKVYQLDITGPIESITEEFVVDSFKKINDDPNGKLVIIRIDTPGGISTSMRTIIKTIMASRPPVAVYVSPKGAQAASAGYLILICADIAAMAPGTNTGAAHPVNMTGKMDDIMKEKVTNDAAAYAKSLAKSRNRNIEKSEMAVRKSHSYTAAESLEHHIIEYVAESTGDLLNQLDGKTVTRVNGDRTTLKLSGETVEILEMSGRQKFLKTITNPSLAYFLLILGLLGLYLEFTHPGIIVPGVIGAICLLLAFMALQVLPINYIGLMLIILSVGFFIAEVKIQGFGMFGIGGIIAFILGSVMLVDAPIPEMRPTMSIIITCAICFAAIFLFLAYKVVQAMNQKTETGQEGLSEKIGETRSVVDKTSGKVFVHGEWWNAVSTNGEPIPEGTKVRIDSIEDFKLKVSPI